MTTSPEAAPRLTDVAGESGEMKTFHREVQIRTAGGLSVTDITEQVREAVEKSGVRDGICCVYSPHTTCSVRVNEYERGFLEDFSVLLRRLVPTEHYYAHDDWDRRTENVSEEEDMENGNGHSHCMSMLLGPAGESIPGPRRRAVSRHLAADPLPRARPRARPPLARAGRRRLGVSRLRRETPGTLRALVLG